MNRRFLLAVLFTGLLALPPAMAMVGHPQQLVRQTTERMLDALRSHRSELEQDHGLIYELVDDILLPHFDFQRIARYALGRYWRKASSTQRQAFVKEFRELLVRTYGLALLNYSDQRITFPPLRMDEGATRVAVATEVVSGEAPPVPIIYKMYLRDGDWQVYDVVIDGVSLVANYRKSFASQIRRLGLDGLIERLRKRNARGPGK